MEIKKRKCFTINEEIDELIIEIMRLSGYDSASYMLRKLVENEAVRLGIRQGKLPQNANENIGNSNLNNLLLNVVKDSNDKLYMLLDCINNIMQYMEISGDFKSASDSGAHEFIKRSQENLKAEKYIAQLNHH